MTEWQKEADRLAWEMFDMAYALGLLEGKTLGLMEGKTDPELARVERFQKRAVDARVALLAHLQGAK